jgi:hypothetical protein
MALAGAVAGLAWAGCREPGDGAPPGGATAESGLARAGVHFKALPEGWRADAADGRVLLAGPAGRPVLRVDGHPGAAGEFPTAEGLEAAFRRGLPSGTVRRVAGGESRADFVSVRLEVTPGPDAGWGTPRDVFLGARKVGKHLFLCSSEPGASDPEMDDAEEACRDFTVQ